MFDINIECNTSTYEYYIENADDMERGGVRRWLINTFAVNNLINESHKLKQRILFENIPSGQQFLTPIIEAMRDGVTITMDYQSFKMNEAMGFDVQPYFVKVFKQRWYLIGMSDKLRIYALDRVHDIRPTTKKFSIPDDFDLEAYFADCYGIICGDDAPAQTIKLRVERYQANYVRALPLHFSQVETTRDDNYSEFEYFIKSTFDFIQEILSMGDYAEVLSPKSFRNEIAKVISRMNMNYKNKK